MSVAASVALAVAERVERTGGPRAGLVAYKALASNASDAEIRGKALVAAARCAVTLRDAAAIRGLVALWPTVESGAWERSIVALCKDLTRAGFPNEAIALARSEAQKRPTALVLYLLARCLDLAEANAQPHREANAQSARAEPQREDARTQAYRGALASAEREGATEIARATRVRLAALLARDWMTIPEAVAEARRVEPASVAPAARVTLARVLLRSPSRFVRAGALGILDGVAKSDDPALARRALAIAARWVDALGALPTPLEVDRLHAIFAPRAEPPSTALPVARMIEAREALRTLERIARSDNGSLVRELGGDPLATRAHDLLRGRIEAPRDAGPIPSEPRERRRVLHGCVLDAWAALRDRQFALAGRALQHLVDIGEPPSRSLVAVARLALGGAAESEELARPATRILALHLERAGEAVPPGGFSALAEALRDNPGLSSLARRAAFATGEAGAAEALAVLLARRGWDRMEHGDREGAIALLREAKQLVVSR